MNKNYVTLGLLLVLSISLVGLPEALARSSYLDAFNTKYGTANTKLDNCDTCHIYGSNERNLYGQDVEIQIIGGATTTTLTSGTKTITIIGGATTTTLTIEQALTNVEPKDSDVDTYSNIDEINALTFPGNSSDYPAPTSTPTPTPTPTTGPTATVTFKVTDDNLNNIQDAIVSVDGIKKKTDSLGTAVFTNMATGNHPYTVSKTRYKRVTGVVSVICDTKVDVKLVLK